MANEFVHLHTHSEYSLLDGLSKIKKMITHVKENGMNCLALTDHGVMYGAIEFYKKAREEGIKPIIGMEAYIADVDMQKKPERGKFKNYHLLLLAKNEEGYKNLMRITSRAHVEGYYYKPRIDHKTLKQYTGGLICTSACAAGEVPQALIENDFEKARRVVKWHLKVFGEDYYLEVQRHRYSDFISKIQNTDVKRDVSSMAENEEKINTGVYKLSREFGIPLVATNDSHYIKTEDATAQDLAVCVATGKKVTDTKRLRMIDTPTFHLTTPKEMKELFFDMPDAVSNTVDLAKKCNLKISTFGKWFFPAIDIPEEKTAKEVLTQRANKGLRKRYKKVTKELQKRLNYELKIIIDKGYPEYFLIFQDMADWAHDNKIPINTRGSAAGSLASYCLGITSVDPIKYLLPFERFLNPFRPTAPDIDLDISDTKRETMISYLTEKYGSKKVAQICTFGRMLARASVRDTARVLGYPYETGDKIAKLIPEGSQGFPMNLTRALEESMELRNFYDTDADAKKIIDLSLQVEGNARHISVHAAGLVISPTHINDFSPIQKEPSGEKIITQYEMHACEDVGLIKLDILGIRNLSILEESLSWIKRTTKKDIDITKIPLDDKKTFKMLSQGNTFGVFQLGSAGMTKYLVELSPERIEDIMIMIALYRPGPMSNIPEFIARKKGKSFKYFHPKMEKYLDKSLGILVYQDDLLYTALEIAGYDWKEVDKFRKAVGKKIPEEMAKQHVIFVEGCQKHTKMTKERAEVLWELFEPFQGYGFNKAHAASYGMVSYQTAYIKANFPSEYMCALLTAESNDTDKVNAAINECKRMGIVILPPDINESEKNFVIVDNKKSLNNKAIRFGLSAIKNVGEAAISTILESKEEKDFSNLVDFLARVDTRKVNKRVLESLIKVGAFSTFGNRKTLLTILDDLRSRISGKKDNKNQQGLFAGEELDDSSQKNSEINTQLEEFSEDEIIDFERELLGIALSAKPLSEILSSIKSKATHTVNQAFDPENVNLDVTIAAYVKEIRVIITKKSGQEMAFVKAEDVTGSIDLVVFPSVFEKVRKYLSDNKAYIINGRVNKRDDDTSIIANNFETGNPSSFGKVYISIPRSAGENKLKRLKKLLVESPGDQSVCLIFEKTKKKINLPIKINWSQSVAKLINSLFSKEVS